jgi:hypothetical protein
MDKRKLELIGAAVILIIVIILIFVLFKRGTDPLLESDAPERIIDRSGLPETTIDARTKESPADVIGRSFVERFGSFSTDVDYINVDDVRELSTAAMQQTLDQVTRIAQAGDKNSSFYGVSTRVITTEVVSESDSVTQILYTTQREETFDTPDNTSTRYQDINLTLVKTGEVWLVDNYVWAE